jgi:hypothetical protein
MAPNDFQENTMRNLHRIAAALLVLGSASASAGSLPKDAEASLLVTGTIEVGPDGTMLKHTIDHPEKLDAGVIGVIDRALGDWRFKPVSAPTSATMRLVLHAKKNNDGKYDTWVGSASFETSQDHALWSYEGRPQPPDYPNDALKNGVGGTVYLYIHVGQDGKVLDAIPAEVDLTKEDIPARMARWRDQLGNAAVDATKAWRFHPPMDQSSTAVVDSEATTTVMVPVEYGLGIHPAPAYGLWKVYFPGPHHQASWLSGTESAAMKNPEALAANGIYPVQHSGLELVTQLAKN